VRCCGLSPTAPIVAAIPARRARIRAGGSSAEPLAVILTAGFVDGAMPCRGDGARQASADSKTFKLGNCWRHRPTPRILCARKQATSSQLEHRSGMRETRSRSHSHAIYVGASTLRAKQRPSPAPSAVPLFTAPRPMVSLGMSLNTMNLCGRSSKAVDAADGGVASAAAMKQFGACAEPPDTLAQACRWRCSMPPMVALS